MPQAQKAVVIPFTLHDDAITPPRDGFLCMTLEESIELDLIHDSEETWIEHDPQIALAPVHMVSPGFHAIYIDALELKAALEQLGVVS